MWLGGGYTYEKLSVSLTYQEWMYADDSERIVDLGFAYDTFLKPSLVIHGRVDGNGAQEDGRRVPARRRARLRARLRGRSTSR